jgi:hypothetical protein
VSALAVWMADRVTAAAISEVVDVKDALSWYLGALGELRAALLVHEGTHANIDDARLTAAVP